ncbi:ribonuclease H-like domain-containing protein [Thiohalorhabdus methylotrophus]|uniref:Ribonuclease H-like domain-containing protein n=1 Tax=Thiohalorhabdus methylotrophus TaxID=3242694 RepID=A0ABV4TUN6_9GAMM
MSRLKGRLADLRRQTGQRPDAPAPESRPAPAGPSLAERVQRAGGARRPPRENLGPEELAERIGAEPLAEGVLVRDRRLSLAEGSEGAALGGAAGVPEALPEATGWDPGRAVFLDTETTGLAGGSGTVAFLVGLARIEGDALVQRQLLLTHFGGEAALLAAVADWLGEGDYLVTFNGKRFDVPLLTTRCLLAGRADPLAGRSHLDLLYPFRRLFGRRFPDCRLATAEQRLLGVTRPDDLPGAEAPQAWFDFLHAGDAGRLPAVVQHNERDLLALAALVPVLDRIHAEPGAWGADVLAAARGHLQRGAEEQAFALLAAQRDALDGEGLRELARLHRRREEWPLALALWEELAARGCRDSRERLAKYWEHIARDMEKALAWAAPLAGTPEGDRRLARLREKGAVDRDLQGEKRLGG